MWMIFEGMVQFEEVKGMEPDNYIGDAFERVSRIYVVTQYNIACCYSGLKAADAGLEALEDCMKCGFEDFDKVRGTPGSQRMRDLRTFLDHREYWLNIMVGCFDLTTHRSRSCGTCGTLLRCTAVLGDRWTLLSALWFIEEVSWLPRSMM
jgi:hypothetical protein